MSDFAFPSRGKRSFWVFLLFPLGGNAVFGWFCFSLRGETRFLPFSARHPWMKRSFYCFPLVIRGWKPVFAVFWWFRPRNSQFSPFFDDSVHEICRFFRFLMKPWAVLLLRGVGSVEILVFNPSEASESFLLAISIHPSPRKACFWQFLFIRGLGKSVFAIFCSAEASDELFFSFSVNPRPRLGCFSCHFL